MHVASLIAAVVAFAFAALWAVIGVAGLVGRFPGNRWAGVRTAETVSSQEAWVLAHRVAAPGFLGGAVVAVLGGLLSLANRWGFVYALGGLLIGLLAVSLVSGVAVRAAQSLIPPQDQGGGCSSGCCSGSDQTGGTGEGQPGSADPAADCGESSCGSCALSSMCLPESRTSDSHHP